MKIALCTSPLSTASRTRGVGAYTRELISALRSSFLADEFVETTGNPYSVKADLVHYPFFDPFFLTLPWRFPKPTIVTIHDLIPLKNPTHFPAGKKGRLKWQVQKFRARRAKAILTDSDSSASNIHSLMGIPKEHIHVVPLASATSRTTLSLIPKLKKLYHLPDRYILYVGDVNWNKNLPGLIQAFAKLDNASTHLVLVGKVFADEPNIPEYLAVKSAIADSLKPKLIHRLGYVPSHHLGAIYREATLYCQPSWDEGFGLPVLEAMKAGCPVISSNRGSLQGVGGDAAVYFDPAKDDLTLILESLLASSTKREALIAAGLLQAKKFTWEKTAKLTRDVYAQVVA
ncbi:MAG: Glycosyl transferase group 1 [Microgenomates group bacterium GW2011_GWC2_46_7]|nr:MAG: Glycosyl transferase group 1 [Microgenomates group bacterium GW2011_GWC2_46_7]